MAGIARCCHTLGPRNGQLQWQGRQAWQKGMSAVSSVQAAGGGLRSNPVHGVGLVVAMVGKPSGAKVWVVMGRPERGMFTAKNARHNGCLGCEGRFYTPGVGGCPAIIRNGLSMVAGAIGAVRRLWCCGSTSYVVVSAVGSGPGMAKSAARTGGASMLTSTAWHGRAGWLRLCPGWL